MGLHGQDHKPRVIQVRITSWSAPAKMMSSVFDAHEVFKDYKWSILSRWKLVRNKSWMQTLQQRCCECCHSAATAKQSYMIHNELLLQDPTKSRSYQSSQEAQNCSLYLKRQAEFKEEQNFTKQASNELINLFEGEISNDQVPFLAWRVNSANIHLQYRYSLKHRITVYSFT